MLAPWLEMKRGNQCPLCAPRPRSNEFVYFVAQLGVSSLYLARNQTHLGTCTLVYDPAHVSRPSELDVESWSRFCADAWTAEAAVSRAFQPDHINLECLGNSVPHLHIHIIPRYRNDPNWGHPVDFRELREAYVTADAECEKLAARLREKLAPE
jgi:diadenosine tetraphosphate (Ap4A) HIT family hydrolase